MKASRRTFLIAGIGVGSSLALQGLAAAEPQKLSESDPNAQQYGYKEEASKVDKSKFADYKAGQECANCSLYQAQGSDAWGHCVLFGTKLVAAHGWCSAYTNS